MLKVNESELHNQMSADPFKIIFMDAGKTYIFASLDFMCDET